MVGSFPASCLTKWIRLTVFKSFISTQHVSAFEVPPDTRALVDLRSVDMVTRFRKSGLSVKEIGYRWGLLAFVNLYTSG